MRLFHKPEHVHKPDSAGGEDRPAEPEKAAPESPCGEGPAPGTGTSSEGETSTEVEAETRTEGETLAEAGGDAEASAEADASTQVPARSANVDFFDLPSDELADYRPAGVIIAPKAKLDLLPVLKLLALAAVLTLIVLGIVWIWPSSSARVPSLVGRGLTDAMGEARARGFEPAVRGWKYSETHSDGTVLEQKPPAMREAKKGDGIVLIVSKGPRPEQGRKPGSPSAQAPSSSPDSGSKGGTYAGKTVCIDPGNQLNPGQPEHTDPSQTNMTSPEERGRGTLTGNPEDLINLDIAMKLKDLLEKDGMNVIMTREASDVQVGEINRAAIASKEGADLLASIHCPTSTDATRLGTQTIFAAENQYNQGIFQKSKAAALYCQSEVLKSCGLEDLGTNPKKDRVVLNWSQVPAFQVEVAYLSNPRDDSMLSQEDFRWKVAWGLRNGIIKYFTNP